MALEEDRIHVKRIVVVSLLLALSFFLLDIALVFIEGIKFTFILNPNVPTAPLEFVLYVLGFGAMGFIVGLIVKSNISDLAIAAQVGPLIFLTINGVALALIVIANPAWATNVLPGFARYYSGMDPYVALPHILRDFFMQYLSLEVN